MGSVSRPSPCCASSTGSSAPCPPAITADSDWAFTSPGGSWKRTAEPLRSTALPAQAPPSPSPCRRARDEQLVPEVRKRDPVFVGCPALVVDALRAVWERLPSPTGRVRQCRSQCLVFSASPCIPSTCTLICFGLFSAFLGSLMRSTPLRHSAVVFSVSTVDGTVKVRLNGP